MHYKTYCFAFQKRRFCTVKAALLQRKTYAFATSKRSLHFLKKLSLQKQCCFLLFPNRFYARRVALPQGIIYHIHHLHFAASWVLGT